MLHLIPILKIIDESYAKFQLSDLLEREVMETKDLGLITMFGNEHPITYYVS